MHSFLTTGSRCIFCKRSVIDSDKDDSKAPSHAVSEESFVCFLRCSTVRSSTCTAEHASDKTTATVQIESSLLSGSFYQTPARLRCVFWRRLDLFLSSSEKKRKKFDLTTAVNAHVRTSAWPGELTVSPLPLYVQCAIRFCLSRLFATRQ